MSVQAQKNEAAIRKREEMLLPVYRQVSHCFPNPVLMPSCLSCQLACCSLLHASPEV